MATTFQSDHARKLDRQQPGAGPDGEKRSGLGDDGFESRDARRHHLKGANERTRRHALTVDDDGIVI
jgi:hypothetical protein